MRVAICSPKTSLLTIFLLLSLNPPLRTILAGTQIRVSYEMAVARLVKLLRNLVSQQLLRNKPVNCNFMCDTLLFCRKGSIACQYFNWLKEWERPDSIICLQGFYRYTYAPVERHWRECAVGGEGSYEADRRVPKTCPCLASCYYLCAVIVFLSIC